MEVQGGRKAYVVITVVVPVVEVEAVGVKVAGIDAVAVGVENLLVPVS